MFNNNTSSAELSDDGRYRFSLTREWNVAAPRLNIIGLNPSTADATVDDPTIRRCMSFAERMGYGSLVMTNLNPVRATDPNEMFTLRRSMTDEDIERNTRIVQQQAFASERVVLAWGNNATRIRPDVFNMVKALRILIGDASNAGSLFTFGMTKVGQPKHPLYLKGDTDIRLIGYRDVYKMAKIDPEQSDKIF